MAFSVVMPALEMAQETGKLIAWHKKEGDQVIKGEPLLEIETDKAVVEIEAPADGFLTAISAQAGSDIPVGQTIAWIVAPGENPPAASEAKAPPAARGKPESHAAPAQAATSQSPASQGARLSPKARRLAKELGVDVAAIPGSGPGGEIIASDIQSAAGARAATNPLTASRADNLEGLTALGRLMAERTAQSWTTVPHFFVSRDIEATTLNRYRDKLTAEIERAHNIRITHTDLLVALTARVLLGHPRLNASWTADGIRLHEYVNVALAIAVTDGVVAPVIPNAHAAGIAEIAKRRLEIAERARARKLRPADLGDATFTISNLGMYHVDAFSAIITPPQAAILAVGRIGDRVAAIDGKAAVRPMMTLTLSCDHRVVDGAKAALFLNELSEALREPQKLI
jgi:pyruvate dehydrogenase E2 component (dihydrolipoamide acetyltransferase)